MMYFRTKFSELKNSTRILKKNHRRMNVSKVFFLDEAGEGEFDQNQTYDITNP